MDASHTQAGKSCRFLNDIAIQIAFAGNAADMIDLHYAQAVPYRAVCVLRGQQPSRVPSAAERIYS